MSSYYNLDGEPISQREWSRLFEIDEYRRVGWDVVNGITISTVWLGLDHGWGRGLQIFETMVFGAEEKVGHWPDGREFRYHEDLEMWRYATYDEAVAGHAAMVALVATLEEVGCETKWDGGGTE